MTTLADGGTLYGYGTYAPGGGGALSRAGGGVHSFQVAGNGSVYWLDSAGKLYGRGPNVNGQLYYGYAVSSYQTTADGSVYWIMYGNLCGYGRYAHGLVSTGVQSFQVAGDGSVYVTPQ